LPITTAKAAVVTARALLFPDRSAFSTTPWLIDKSLASEEFLLGSAKGETVAAIRASQDFVRIAHG